MNPESSSYREQLASDITGSTDRAKRRELLNEARQTDEYKQARSATITNRQGKIQERKEIEGQRDKLRGGESTEILMDGTEAFTEELIHKYPQTNENGELNYYLSGSLAVMVLLKGGRFKEVDATQLPQIVTLSEKEVPPEAVEHLNKFVRKIGDLDYVPLEHWKQLPLDQRMGKGGSQIIKDELSDSARNVFKWSETQASVMCDPLEASGTHRVVAVPIGNKEVYITEPRTTLAYKLVHIAESFDNNPDKIPKFLSDFKAMFDGLGTMYSRDELLQSAYEVIFEYNKTSPNGLELPYHNPQFKGEVKQVFEEVLALDPDAKYLELLTENKERSIGVLRILHRIPDPDGKQKIIEFVNSHPEEVSTWQLNTNSQHNREVVADFTLTQPQFLNKANLDNPSKESLIEYFKTYTGNLRDFSQKMPDQSVLEHTPTHSYFLDILMSLDSSTLEQELKAINELLELKLDVFQLSLMLRSEYATDSNRRKSIFNTLKQARAVLDDKEFPSIMLRYKDMVSSSGYYDSDAYVRITDENRPQLINAVLEKFGVLGNNVSEK